MGKKAQEEGILIGVECGIKLGEKRGKAVERLFSEGRPGACGEYAPHA